MLRFAELQKEHRQYWPAALTGDFKAIDRCIQNMDERIHLMDLDSGAKDF